MCATAMKWSGLVDLNITTVLAAQFVKDVVLFAFPVSSECLYIILDSASCCIMMKVYMV